MNTLRQHLESLRNRGLLDRFAWAFARCLDRFAPDGQADDALFLLAALTAHHTLADKHVCLVLDSCKKLSDILDGLDPADDRDLPLWEPVLRAPFCGQPGSNAPLILDGGRVYLNRYFDYETGVARILNERAAVPATPVTDFHPASCLDPSFTLDDSQKAAIQAALGQPFTVITGGPGTGKTTILAVILVACLQTKPGLRIAACAPTGKAQVRMKEAIDQEMSTHILPSCRTELPITYGTIHRLLDYNPESNKFVHGPNNPLAADIVVADEISMADLPLFYHLLAAVPPDAKLILLGDRDQLSSVESGAVLSDICEAWAKRPLVARLAHSHRFKEGSLIERFKNFILEQNPDAALALLKDAGADRSVVWKTVPPAAVLAQPLEAELQAHPVFRNYKNAATPAEALRAFDTFRILTATRRGYFGAERLNAQLQGLLGIMTNGKGYPILITENDPEIELFNGDVGLCWPDDSDVIKVYFPDGADCRAVPLARLPAHEPVFAMTIHKSQGSGFENILVVLPENAENKLLTRELLYTGLTRAKKTCTLWSTPESLRAAITRQTSRDSGLKSRLSTR